MRVFDLVPIVRSNIVVTAKLNLTVNLSQEGILKPSSKVLYIFDDIYSRLPLLALSFKSAATAHVAVGANAISGNRAIIAYDHEEPRGIAIRMVSINQDLILNIDLNDGSGGGFAGDPASVAAMVRADKLPAVRELVAIEKTTTGEWRMAGNQNLQLGELEMQVTGGQVFAVGLDDYGIPYQADLLVTEGQRIRPSNMQGWLYLITQAGQLPAQEPSWWPAQGENPPRELGTARAQAVRYYRPQALGPIKYELK